MICFLVYAVSLGRMYVLIAGVLRREGGPNHEAGLGCLICLMKGNVDRIVLRRLELLKLVRCARSVADGYGNHTPRWSG